MKLRAGDIVKHEPSEEEWVVAIDEDSNGDIMWCGWPEGWAKASDCTLIKSATDEERIKLLTEIARSKRRNLRGHKAMGLLEAEKTKTEILKAFDSIKEKDLSNENS